LGTAPPLSLPTKLAFTVYVERERGRGERDQDDGRSARRGRPTNSPPQLGHLCASGPAPHSAQNVHS
jgi:hypothetical protein